MKKTLAGLAFLLGVSLFSGCVSSEVNWENKRINRGNRQENSIKISYIESQIVSTSNGYINIKKTFVRERYYDKDKNGIFETLEREEYNMDEEENITLKSKEVKKIDVPIEYFINMGFFEELKNYGPY